MESALREGRDEPRLRLIETILWDGVAAPRWPLHLARLERSAKALGWPYLAPPELPKANGPARLRLTMAKDGSYTWESFPLPPPPLHWRLGLAKERLRSDDPWLQLKSTRRALHDAARAVLPEGIDELLFLNEHDELCEGTITNLFFDRGQGLRTPPLTAGALPGVLRAELNCPEERLFLADLPKVRLWVGNALRGLIPATFEGPLPQ